MTIVEKILAAHAGKDSVTPGEIVEVDIDARVARDFGGASVAKHLEARNLGIHDPSRTFFTFDCNPTGSDQKYAVNQHFCRNFARENGLKVYDIDKGIGTHVLIEEGLAYPGSTAVSTDSHANILGAVGAFGQGMGDRDIAAVWHKGHTWFKVPPTVKIVLEGVPRKELTAKDLVLNLLDHFGASSLLGQAMELEGEMVEALTLDERITVASMATEMGAVIMLIPPNREVIRYCESRARKKVDPVFADEDASYTEIHRIKVDKLNPRISLPGKPHDTAGLPETRIWIDSAFIGSCTNGRIGDLRAAAAILKGRQVAEGVVLKIVPATDRVWMQCMEEGLIEVFKESGALVSNAGCAGCAAGQVGQNGPGEVTISTGNRNFPGKQGAGEVYLASPSVVAATAVAGFITGPDGIPSRTRQRKIMQEKASPAATKQAPAKPAPSATKEASAKPARPLEFKGKVHVVPLDNIDTDMIFHNRYLTITDPEQMGQYTFDNLKGHEDFNRRVQPGDILLSGRNFGSGSSRQQAVDCFPSLGISCIIARSFGAIYERNAINAAFPILASVMIDELQARDGDELHINLTTGLVRNLSRDTAITAVPFSEVQLEIYQNNGLF